MVPNEVLVQFVCIIVVCTFSAVGGGCGIHVCNDERVQFPLSITIIVMCACISKREACAFGGYRKANRCQ